MAMLDSNDAEHGCAIVMEVKTGKIKAIANLGKDKNGNYIEDYNYAITPSEPGSTFKLATMLTVLEDRKVSLNTPVDLHGGVWQIYGQTVYDSEKHGLGRVTVKEAFEHSSNVGMAKLAWQHYGTNPKNFLSHLHELRMDSVTGIDLKGEIKPRIYKPGDRSWSKTTLPWMGFGYNLMVSPLQIVSLYNAVANNGVMMKPYLVNAITQDGQVVKEFQPTIVNEAICSKETLKALRACLEGVVLNGTGKSLKNNSYLVAGKTGTALVANGSRGYVDKIYQSSFAGYFPADNPQYTIIVTIKNKPHAAVFYGASVAGPVFKEIADALFTLKVNQQKNYLQYASAPRWDSGNVSYAGYAPDIKQVSYDLQLPIRDTEGKGNWSRMNKQASVAVLAKQEIRLKQMPQLQGMGLKDVVYLCENLGLKVNVRGKGKVIAQSISAGQNIARGQSINIQLN
jgi:cell division protein FtsI (penicillin-binding protein 3)